jgi:hypothetical protein
MSDNEEEIVVTEPIEEMSLPEPKQEDKPAIEIEIDDTKPKKKEKKPMSAERKAQLMKNLEKGRAKALETRRKNALERKRLKEEQNKFADNNPPPPKPVNENDFKSQIDELKNLIMSLRKEKNPDNKEELDKLKQELKEVKREEKQVKKETKKEENPVITIPIKKRPKPEPEPEPEPVPVEKKRVVVSTFPTNIWSQWQ